MDSHAGCLIAWSTNSGGKTRQFPFKTRYMAPTSSLGANRAPGHGGVKLLVICIRWCWWRSSRGRGGMGSPVLGGVAPGAPVRVQLRRRTRRHPGSGGSIPHGRHRFGGRENGTTSDSHQGAHQPRRRDRNLQKEVEETHLDLMQLDILMEPIVQMEVQQRELSCVITVATSWEDRQTIVWMR